MLKKTIWISLLSFTGLILSALSWFIKNGTDESQEATIGIITHYGFPVHFCNSAPGMAWAQYDGGMFLLNAVIWCIILFLIYKVSKYRLKTRKTDEKQAIF